MLPVILIAPNTELRLRAGDPQLGHHSEVVGDTPMLGDLAVGDALDLHAGDLDPFASRRDAHELARLRAAERETSDDPVAFRDHLVDLEVKVRKAGSESTHDGLHAGRTVGQTRDGWVVIDVVG